MESSREIIHDFFFFSQQSSMEVHKQKFTIMCTVGHAIPQFDFSKFPKQHPGDAVPGADTGLVGAHMILGEAVAPGER